ncbi:putative leader peptide [Bailinhaonella thermotolerans]
MVLDLLVRFSVVSVWLVERRHVDLCRVASVLCRASHPNAGL